MVNWSEEALRQALGDKKWISTEKPIQHGIQFLLVDGSTKVNWFHTGNISVQGKADGLLKSAAEQSLTHPPTAAVTNLPPVEPDAPTPSAPSAVVPKRIFVVHGHDHQSLDQLQLLLMNLQLQPVVIQNLPGSGDTLIEKLDDIDSTDYACVLLTPDDEGRARKADTKPRPRARQNVILELGMVLARLGRQRVAILVKGKNLERPSDIDGLIYIPYSNHVREAKEKVVANLIGAGFKIDSADIIKG